MGAWIVGLLAIVGVEIIQHVSQDVVMEWAQKNAELVRRMREAVNDWVVLMASESVGIALDSNNPMSDASLSNAVSARMGVTIRTLRDADSIKSDLEWYALALLEQKTGLRVRSVHDSAAIAGDVLRYLSPMLAAKTGLPVSDLSNAAAVKGDIETYMKARALEFLASDVERARSVVAGSGVDMEALAKRVAEKGGINPKTGEAVRVVTADNIVNAVVARAVIESSNEGARLVKMTARTMRRRKSQREASARYRKAHPARYEPI